MTTRLWSTEVEAASIQVERSAWVRIIELAHEYGWKPAGTTPPYYWDGPSATSLGGHEPWDGDYLAGCWQEVTPEDAALIADALEGALADINGLISLCRSGGFLIA